MEYQVGEYCINETVDDQYQVGELMMNEDQGGGGGGGLSIPIAMRHYLQMAGVG